MHSIRFDSMKPEIPIIHTNENLIFKYAYKWTLNTLGIRDKEFVHIDSFVPFDSCCCCRCCRALIYYSSPSIAWMICFSFGWSAIWIYAELILTEASESEHIWNVRFHAERERISYENRFGESILIASKEKTDQTAKV